MSRTGRGNGGRGALRPLLLLGIDELAPFGDDLAGQLGDVLVGIGSQLAHDNASLCGLFASPAVSSRETVPEL